MDPSEHYQLSRQKSFLLHLALIASSIAFLKFDIVPDWNYATAVQLSSDSRAFPIRFQFEKLIAGLLVFLIVRFGLKWDIVKKTSAEKLIGQSLFFAVFTSIVLLVPALLIQYVRLDPKLPDITWIWAIHNLLFVSFGEEVLFRGYLQNGLTRLFRAQLKGARSVPLILTALLFGLTHFQGGLAYVTLASIAGLFYGLVFQRAGLPGAVLTHFLVNLTHFCLFSYPSLVTH